MNEWFCTFLNSALVVSLLALVLLPLRPVLDRRYHAKGRLHLWMTLFICLINTLNLSRQNVRYGENGVSAIQLMFPYARLVWTDASPLPQLVTTPLLPPGLAAKTLAGLPADFAGDTSRLELAAETVSSVDVLTVLGWLWLVGAVAVLGFYLIQHVHFRWQVRRWSLPVQNPALLATVATVQAKLQRESEEKPEPLLNRLKGPVRLLLCDWVSGPMVTGKYRPRLILPREDYSSDEAYYICLHELTHLKNDDLGNRFLYLLLNSIYWFAPPVWAMRRAAYRDMELACDESVLTNTSREQKSRYCRTLLDAVPHRSGKTTALTTYFRGDGPSLRERLNNIWYEGKPRKSSDGLYLCLILVVLFASTFGISVSYAKDRISPESELANLYQTSSGKPEDFTCFTSQNSWEWKEAYWLEAYLASLQRLPEGDPLRITGYHINRASPIVIERKYTPDDRRYTNLIGNFTLVPAEPDSPWFAQKTIPCDDMPGNVTLTMVYELVYEEDGSYFTCVAHVPAELGIHYYNRSLLHPDYEDVPENHVYFGIDWS